MRDVRVNVHHITRVEGHGNITVNVMNGELKDCQLDIVETPRFFEAMLRGRPYAEASPITSRICGICAVGHATTALRAVEKSLGVPLSQQTKLLRRLNFLGEILDSHVLHVYMLVTPDFLGVGSVIPLAKSAPEVVLRALRLKQLAGDLCQIIGGRHTHPVAMAVGGFTHLPNYEELESMRQRFIAARADVEETVKLYESLEMPAFERETEYIALRPGDGSYGFIDGDIVSTDGGTWPVEAYRSITNEYLVPHSSAKHARHQRESYMVGALARFNVNYDRLLPFAKEVAERLNLVPKCTNPYMNTLAQVVEIAHCIEEGIGLTDDLLETGIRWEVRAAPTVLSGEGVGACEVPRGTLFHKYRIEEGKIVEANCIIPTGQNLANIELDMRALVPQIVDRPRGEITHMLEMLVRAYDPCISCSTHMVKVNFL